LDSVTSLFSDEKKVKGSRDNNDALSLNLLQAVSPVFRKKALPFPFFLKAGGRRQEA